MNTVRQSSAVAVYPIPDVIGVFGALTFLAARCPLHRRYSAAQLNQIFMPAVEHSCLRLFQNADGIPCAALIWARLSPKVASRMLRDNAPPAPQDWASGDELWFMDVLAPFGHGAVVARNLARNPPDEGFGFARLGPDGRVRKIVRVPKAGTRADSGVGRRMRTEIRAAMVPG